MQKARVVSEAAELAGSTIQKPWHRTGRCSGLAEREKWKSNGDSGRRPGMCGGARAALASWNVKVFSLVYVANREAEAWRLQF
ncbi:hypothetical protein KM043_003674 [Ampulex compressa]|nr:hypothetical protein KM043_003674 [Ampulex compressa]